MPGQLRTKQNKDASRTGTIPTTLLASRERADTGNFLRNWPKAKTAKEQAEAIGKFMTEYIHGSKRLCNCKVLVMKDFELFSDCFKVELRDNYRDEYPLISMTIAKSDVSHSLSYMFLEHMASGTMMGSTIGLSYEWRAHLAEFMGDLISYLDKCPVGRQKANPAQEQREQLIYDLTKEFYNAQSNSDIQKAARRLHATIIAEIKSEGVEKDLKFAGDPASAKNLEATMTFKKEKTTWIVNILGKEYPQEKGTHLISDVYERPGMWIGPGEERFIAETRTRNHLKSLLADAARFPSSQLD